MSSVNKTAKRRIYDDNMKRHNPMYRLCSKSYILFSQENS
jgi:hypothetical protein